MPAEIEARVSCSFSDSCFAYSANTSRRVVTSGRPNPIVSWNRLRDVNQMRKNSCIASTEGVRGGAILEECLCLCLRVCRTFVRTDVHTDKRHRIRTTNVGESVQQTSAIVYGRIRRWNVVRGIQNPYWTSPVKRCHEKITIDKSKSSSHDSQNRKHYRRPRQRCCTVRTPLL